ncbi:MAG: lysophospholipid acyltransferase family protein [Promethearchaeota archaeon]
MSIKFNSYKQWSFLRKAFYLSLTPVLPRITRILFRLEVKNIENTFEFPEGRGVIFCVNHQSHLDGIILISAILAPFGPRRFLGFIASGKILLETFLGRLMLILGGIPIFSNNPKPTLDYVSKSILDGFAVLITPQGRRIHRTPFHDYFSLAKEGRTGVGRIILTTNGEIPVIPVYIHGTSEALKPGTILPKFGSFISISFGEPLYFHQYSRQDGWFEDDPDFFLKAREITNEIMHSIRGLFLITEKYYIEFLELKFNKKIERIKVPLKNEKEFNKILQKLTRVPPKHIQQFLESKANN